MYSPSRLISKRDGKAITTKISVFQPFSPEAAPKK